LRNDWLLQIPGTLYSVNNENPSNKTVPYYETQENFQVPQKYLFHTAPPYRNVGLE
jgi:hypothetical protein